MLWEKVPKKIDIELWVKQKNWWGLQSNDGDL
jgi:hypothetical protein